MANSEAGWSSVPARAFGGEYQVFLNFRGPDTRRGFTDFLYHDLLDAGVRVFRDEDELRVGEVIGGNLLCAINNSMIYIPIFSVTYASSKWCLRELAHIRDNVSKSDGEKCILPIFFHVEPEDVKLRTSLYSDALLEHEKNFPVEEVKWRKALVEVGKIKGWNVKKDESQATIVKLVVERVLEKLKLKQRLVPEHLVGLDDWVKHLIELLDVNHRNVRLIGIYGMGGIGKTTVAKVVFNELLSHFGKCSSFLENVREKMSTEDGIVQLQKKLLSDIADSGSAREVQDVEEGMRRIGDVLSTKKVLVVLDDADNKDHIKRLIGNNSLHSGSRIIITTRNMAILQVKGLEGEIVPYEMLQMDDPLALQLFCRHAFGRDFPSDGYHWLSNKIVSSIGGLPLTVKVIGALLDGKNKAFWEETLSRLRNVPEKEILETLRISYDDLDEYEQHIFLDIACFFFNKEKTDVIYMWDSCQFCPERGINVLTNRCLIKILDNDKFWMHDQLIDMGRQIVRQESRSDLGEQSRLWIAKEALEIIKTEVRKDKVQALVINEKNSSMEITNKDFERLPNLRFLQLHNGTYYGDFTKCPSNLKWISWQPPFHDPMDDVEIMPASRSISRWISWLRWISCPPRPDSRDAGYIAKCCSKLGWISWQPPLQDFRANHLYLKDLVVFKLGRNCFANDSKAWDLIKEARNLKVLSLSQCQGITTIPDFSKCTALERLTLACCNNLKRIESFIGDLRRLINLEIVKCKDLTDLPEDVGELVKLERLLLWGCRGLRELPGSLGNLTSLIELDLHGTSISELPNSIEKLKSSHILHFANTKDDSIHVQQFPSGIGTLVNIQELDLSMQCGMRGDIPVAIGELSSLKILNLGSTHISKIPRTINMLHSLKLLSCDRIEELPELPTSLTCLLLRSMSLRLVPDLSNLTNLVTLELSDGSFYRQRSNLITGCNLRGIGRLSRLESLHLSLLNVHAPPELASLSRMKFLELRGLDLESLMQLPSSYSRFRNLSDLVISCCKVEDIPLDGLPQLEKITVDGCGLLKRFSIHLELTKLRHVNVYCCPKLVIIQVVGLSNSLEYLSIHECQSLRRVGGLSYLKKLENLAICQCKLLLDVEGLDELKSLKSLTVKVCPSLRRLSNVSYAYIPDDCRVTIWECGNFNIASNGFVATVPLKSCIESLLCKVRPVLH